MFFILFVSAFLTQLLHTISADKLAQVGDFPFQVAIIYHGKYICAGALIVHNFVATAAHCVIGKNYRYMNIIVSAVDEMDFLDADTKVADRILVHPRYTPSTKDFNIALIKLRDLLRGSNIVDIIDLPEPDYEISGGTVGKLIYWDQREAAVRLNSVDVVLWDPDNCTAVNIWGEYDYNTEVPLTGENTLCASIPRGSCVHDDASSLVVDDKLLGIVSWNEACDSSKFPLVFSNMAIYGEWIDRIFSDEDKYLG
ncbi:trypsin-3-like [Calliphora vicina]|uniref:trypsin-3-like n=1 Tax=Calliphora vicina TaxID=7373 RepID=UPI00325C2DC8